jgi:hypothetical protein
MQRNSTTGSAVPAKYENDSDSNDAPPAARVRTFSANSARDFQTSSTGAAAPRSNNLTHYRSNSARLLRLDNDAYDPLLMASLDRPAPEDEAETVSIFGTMSYLGLLFIQCTTWSLFRC